jgi:NAD+ kinase
MSAHVATVMTHRRADETAGALQELLAAARAAEWTLRFDPDETAKHDLRPGPGVEVDVARGTDCGLVIVLGGDGTILTALREYADTEVPVFGVNFGQVGFLATIDPDGVGTAFERAFAGDFDVIDLPSITATRPDRSWTAFNDVSLHRQAGLRVADLSYALGGEEVGRVRCDGIVVAAPQGSTGYNLANGGPVLAWGVEGFVVSFIAPHSFTARPLVVAPTDTVTITNASREEPVELHADGRPAVELGPGEHLSVEFGRSRGRLAQLPGATFYHRLRERFGRLAT